MTTEKQRFLLKKSRMNEFEGWMNMNGIRHRGPNGKHEVCQIRFNDGKFGWACLYWRYVQKLHYTVDPRLVPLVMRFLADTDTLNESAEISEEPDPFEGINRKTKKNKYSAKAPRREKGTIPKTTRSLPTEPAEYVNENDVRLIRAISGMDASMTTAFDSGWKQKG